MTSLTPDAYRLLYHSCFTENPFQSHSVELLLVERMRLIPPTDLWVSPSISLHFFEWWIDIKKTSICPSWLTPVQDEHGPVWHERNTYIHTNDIFNADLCGRASLNTWNCFGKCLSCFSFLYDDSTLITTVNVIFIDENRLWQGFVSEKSSSIVLTLPLVHVLMMLQRVLVRWVDIHSCSSLRSTSWLEKLHLTERWQCYRICLMFHRQHRTGHHFDFKIISTSSIHFSCLQTDCMLFVGIVFHYSFAYLLMSKHTLEPYSTRKDIPINPLDTARLSNDSSHDNSKLSSKVYPTDIVPCRPSRASNWGIPISCSEQDTSKRVAQSRRW